jgi:hypothetical protein
MGGISRTIPQFLFGACEMYLACAKFDQVLSLGNRCTRSARNFYDSFLLFHQISHIISNYLVFYGARLLSLSQSLKISHFLPSTVPPRRSVNIVPSWIADSQRAMNCLYRG